MGKEKNTRMKLYTPDFLPNIKNSYRYKKMHWMNLIAYNNSQNTWEGKFCG